MASDVGGHRELIRDEETGFLFSSGDPKLLAEAILNVLRRRNQWDEIRAAGRKFVETERTWSQERVSLCSNLFRFRQLSGKRIEFDEVRV